MELFTDDLLKKLLANGLLREADPKADLKPVVKLFTPDGACTWLLSEISPDDEEIAFGLCDFGMGRPELGYISIKGLRMIRGSLGLPVERDINFDAEMTINEYASRARDAGLIQA